MRNDPFFTYIWLRKQVKLRTIIVLFFLFFVKGKCSKVFWIGCEALQIHKNHRYIAWYWQFVHTFVSCFQSSSVRWLYSGKIRLDFINLFQIRNYQQFKIFYLRISIYILFWLCLSKRVAGSFSFPSCLKY